jgi:hypothetical protein
MERLEGHGEPVLTPEVLLSGRGDRHAVRQSPDQMFFPNSEPAFLHARNELYFNLSFQGLAP